MGAHFYNYKNKKLQVRILKETKKKKTKSHTIQNGNIILISNNNTKKKKTKLVKLYKRLWNF